MTMPLDDAQDLDQQDLDQALCRLQELIRALDTHPDPTAREPARELLALVLDLHGIGLAKLMATVAAADGGTSIMARLVENDQVRALLLLHGLHPDDLETRIRRAVDRLQPHVGIHGLRLDVAAIAGGTVRLRVRGAGAAAIPAPLPWSLPGEIENAVLDAAPDVEQVVIDGLDLPNGAVVAQAAE
jgi:hypothetical protein